MSKHLAINEGEAEEILERTDYLHCFAYRVYDVIHVFGCSSFLIN